jgi:hypothetical protein
MIKQITAFVLLICGTLTANAQLSAVSFKSDEYLKFMSSKTLVVKTGSPEYDQAVEDGMKEFWKVTQYEFISESEFEKRISDPAVSFIASIIISGQSANQNYHYLALFNGGKKKIEKYSYGDMLAYCPRNYWVNEKTTVDCAYRVANMIGGLALTVGIMQKSDIKGNGMAIADMLQKEYNSKSAQIKDRTLLFCKETVGSKLKETDIAAAYPFKYEFCTMDKLKQVIKSKSKDYYYFQPGITLNKSMFVIDPSTSECVYFDYDMMGLFIKKGDLEDLTKTIKEGKVIYK